eukprot:2573697-Pyramimonas_sp.AAC.1
MEDGSSFETGLSRETSAKQRSTTLGWKACSLKNAAVRGPPWGGSRVGLPRSMLLRPCSPVALSRMEG